MKKKISLGFTNQKFEQGAHVCQIFNNDEERHSALINYIVSGLEADEDTACFSENETQHELAEFFKQHDIDYKEAAESENFSLSKTGEAYFEDNKFDPDRMLSILRKFYEKSIERNRGGARVIGEMTPEIMHIEGGDRLMEYESRVSMLQKECPVTTVCQYDAREFDGAAIMDILKVHPYMIVRGSIVHNPFFIQPEEYLKKHC